MKQKERIGKNRHSDPAIRDLESSSSYKNIGRSRNEFGMTNVRAFTIIELLVSISILATISIVAYVSISGHMKIANNATRIAAIDSLHLSLRDYYQMKKILPEPNSNYVVYDERGTYMHSFSGAYGVSGHVSYDFLPAGYVNFEATDPESHQFYGYGKTLGSTTKDGNDENDAKFDVAAVLYDEKTGGYKTYVKGTYEKQRLSSLIRAYSSSNFVSQDSTEDLPYNPYERKVTAYISSFSGTLSLTIGGTIIPPITSPASYTGELNSGDIITIGTGSTALLHISDGSELSLGSAGSQTILALSSLEYNDDNNLASKVKLILTSGELWTEAPHLRTEADSVSDFSIQTDSALAAVRGTVFGIAKNPLTDTTAISLKVGTLEVSKITTKENGEILSQTGFTSSNGFSSTATGGFVSSGSLSYMIVPENGTPIILDGIQNPTLEGGTIPPTSTDSLNPYDIDRKINHPPFSLGYRPLADKISFTHTGVQAGTDTGTLSVTFQNYGADFYRLSFGTGEVNDENILSNPNPFYTGTLSIAPGPVTITGAFRYHADPNIDQYYTLMVCLREMCSSSDIKNLPTNLFDWGPFYIWGEKKGTVRDTPAPCLNSIKDFCDEPNLVAYAPYNMAGDLQLYGTGGRVLDDGSNAAQISGNNTPLNSSIVGVQHYLTGQSFVEMSSGTKGIFIDNVGTGEYLKYTFPPNFLTGSFSIEMSVRGGALKRWDISSKYKLFNFNQGSNLNIFNNASSHYLSFFLASGVYSKILDSDLNLKITDNNKFYKVISKVENGVPSLSISDGNNIILTGSLLNSGTPPSIYGNDLYVGSDSILSNQWNDIINSVKIFKY